MGERDRWDWHAERINRRRNLGSGEEEEQKERERRGQEGPATQPHSHTASHRIRRKERYVE